MYSEFNLVNEAVSAAGTYIITRGNLPEDTEVISCKVNFTGAADGTSLNVYFQSFIEDAWFDIACVKFENDAAVKAVTINARENFFSPVDLTDGEMLENSILQGFLGNKLRVKYIVDGTYTDSNLKIDVGVR